MDIVALSAALAAGKITQDAIRKEFGNDVLSEVLALAGGVVVGQVIYSAVDALNPLDEILDIF